MTGAGWFFMGLCWTVLAVVTVWCFTKILGPAKKAD